MNAPRRFTTALFVFAAILTLGSAASAVAAGDVETRVVTGPELRSLFAKIMYPVYPYEARRAHLSGAGIYRMYVEPGGTVRSVGVMKSTGSPILDLAAAGGLYHCKAKPYARQREIDMPVTFVLGPVRRPRS